MLIYFLKFLGLTVCGYFFPENFCMNARMFEYGIRENKEEFIMVHNRVLKKRNISEKQSL